MRAEEVIRFKFRAAAAHRRREEAPRAARL